MIRSLNLHQKIYMSFSQVTWPSNNKEKAVFVQRNTEARSRTNCCSGKAINITYSECVFAALHIQHAKQLCHTVICGLSGSTIFFFSHYFKTARILKNAKYKTCFDFLYNLCPKILSVLES